MKDSTMLALGVISVAGIIAVALIFKKTDRGTILLRDEQGNITAILPMDSYFIDQKYNPSNPPAVLKTDFDEPFLESHR